MDAIVTAGGIPLPEEPLYPATRGQSKAMLDVAGKPMIQWVLDALTDAKTVDNVIIVGTDREKRPEMREENVFCLQPGQDGGEPAGRRPQSEGSQSESQACADRLLGYPGYHR